VMLSINPDAHHKNGYADMYYGLCVGRKGGLTAAMTFNALSRDEVEKHFEMRKERAISTLK
ncbi:MAG: DNA polymerase/3'-5' exonuclease PolX, partial [Cyclobacteriaceae bacterium]|nr:DNA polymerase/3'-5' exonuclease PolX [Cyclobacteriaceae bacterium]